MTNVMVKAKRVNLAARVFGWWTLGLIVLAMLTGTIFLCKALVGLVL